MAIKSVKKSTKSETKKKASVDMRSRSSMMALAVLSSLIVSAIAYWGFVGPQFQRVGAGRELDIMAAQAMTEAGQERLNQLNTLRNNYTGIPQQDIDKVALMLPDREQIPELLAQLEAIARDSGISLISINIAEVEEQVAQSARQRLQAQQSGQQAAAQGGIHKLNIRADVSAFQYPRFRRFIESLQSHIRIFDVTDFNYSAENQFHSVTIQTYYLSS